MNIEDIKKLRESTGAGMMDAKSALEEAKGNYDEAIKVLRKKGLAKAAKKADRNAAIGVIESYVHGGKIGVLVEVNCETDFVARTDDFKEFTRNVAMHIAAANPVYLKWYEEVCLNNQSFVKDPAQTIEELRQAIVAKLGENIVIARFSRMEVGSIG